MEATFDPMLGYVKPHPYYKDIQVSSLGMVRIFDHVRKEFVWTYGMRDEKRGRLIWASGHSCLRICRLVAETFIPNSDRLPLVLHKDGNLDNNALENLCWGNHCDMQSMSRPRRRVEEQLGISANNDFEGYCKALCKSRNQRYAISRKPYRKLLFSDGLRHRVSIEDWEKLISLPIAQRIYNGDKRYNKIYDNSYPIDAGEVRCHPTMKHIGASSNGYIRVYNERIGKFRFTKGTMAGALGYILKYKGKTYKVCRLIAETFIPNPASKPLVIHKDNDPSNNCVDNLFWGDYKDMQYNSKKNKPTYEKLGVDPYDRKAARKAQYKIWKSNHPRLQFAGHVWHRVTQEEFNLLRPIPWKERSLPERYRK